MSRESFVDIESRVAWNKDVYFDNPLSVRYFQLGDSDSQEKILRISVFYYPLPLSGVQ